MPLDSFQVPVSVQEASAASRDNLEVVAPEQREESFEGFVGSTCSPAADRIAGPGNQREDAPLSKNSRSSSEKMAKTGEHTRKHCAKKHPGQDLQYDSDSAVNAKSKGTGEIRSEVSEPSKSESLKKSISIKKENRLVTISSKTNKSKHNPLEHSKSDTLGSDFEFQESIHSSSHLT